MVGGGGGAITGQPAPVGSTTIIIAGSSGGLLLSHPVNLIPGEAINLVIGSGGLATTQIAPTPTSAIGGTTSFGSYLSCTGGQPQTSWPAEGSCLESSSTWIGGGSKGGAISTINGHVLGGQSPLIYGTGGASGNPGTGMTWGTDGAKGVVIVDVLY
jgi:hypothetical protein